MSNIAEETKRKTDGVHNPPIFHRWGAVFTDHMLEIHWDDQNGFSDPKIVKYGDIVLSPAAKCLHYGLQLFEGLKVRVVEGICSTSSLVTIHPSSS